ncbi:sensor histidine kinase [Pseudonocardia sediminis]|uniref:sensor histidine kinase n=1 Tax=Pseudonocardia sediminis TaxID=1397368 RepID=UPI0013EEFFD9|nr:histidine kinase [Pseudonocardia sediminis]
MIAAAGSWVRGRPRAVDAAVAVVVLAYTLPIQGAYVPAGLPAGTGVLVSVGLCAPWVVRRSFPLGVFGAVVAVFLVQFAIGMGPVPADVMLFLALYAVAVHRRRAVSVGAAAVLAACALLASARWGDGRVSELLTAAVSVVTVWMWGSMIGIRRAHVATLRERAAALERERDQRDRAAVEAERARIAREIHDIVSHSLSVVVVLARGASASVRTDPDRAVEALAAVEGTGRSALTEMRRMLGVLRDGEPGSPPPGTEAPQPGVAQLAQLVGDARTSGTPVMLTVDGTPGNLPAGTDLAVYRIVQEALTNARRHAGPDLTRVDVHVRIDDDTVRVDVVDDGRGPVDGPAGGHGLAGMRERVATHGGTLHTGAGPGGGFTVSATLPVGEDT